MKAKKRNKILKIQANQFLMLLTARVQALAAAIPVIPQFGVEQAELIVMAGLSYTMSNIISIQFMWLSKFCKKVVPRQLYVILALFNSITIEVLSLAISTKGRAEIFLMTTGTQRVLQRDLIPEELRQAITLGLI